jgi:hypothetical protein
MNMSTASLERLRAQLRDRSMDGVISWSAAREIARRRGDN